MSNRPVVVFLDDDHVVGLLRAILGEPRSADAAVRAFVAPEPADFAVVRRLRRGLEAGVDIDLRAGAGAVPDATALVFRRGSIGSSMIAGAPALALVQRLGESAAGIDLAAARRWGVAVSCLPRPSLISVSEHVLLLMLALARRLVVADRAVRAAQQPGGAEGAVAYNWVGLDGLRPLCGRTLGLVGLGEVGRLVAVRARALGMQVLYADRARLDTEQEASLGASYRPLERLLEEAEVVSLHVPLQGNEKLLDRRQLARLRPGALVINTSRGALIDEQALREALEEGRLGGVALDVHAREPRPAGDQLSARDDVILTPHVAGGSRLDVLSEAEAIFDNVRAVLAGSPPPHGRVEDRP